jgi:hypothetical protein
MDSALSYSAQEARERSRSQSLPQDVKSPEEALPAVGEGTQNLSSIYLATESAPASPFGSMTQVGYFPSHHTLKITNGRGWVAVVV